MKILAIDTSFDACSAAIVADGAALWSETKIIGRGHSEVLPVMVASGVAATGLAASDFDRVAVVIGPGAFAGVRVGLAFARGLCLGTQIRAVGVTSTRALAASVDAAPVATVFDARRSQVYAALYGENLSELIAPFVASPAEAARRIGSAVAGDFALAGSGAELIAPHVNSLARLIGRRRLDPIAIARLAGEPGDFSSSPLPLYLREPDAAPSSGSIFHRGRSP